MQRARNSRIAIALLIALVHFAVGASTHAHPLSTASTVVFDAADDSRSSDAGTPQAEICSICSAIAAGLALCTSRAPDPCDGARLSLWAAGALRSAAAPLWASAASRAPPLALSAIR